MNLIDLLTSAWAITPEKLDEIQAIYSTHFRGDKIDIEAIEARLGRPLANDQQEYVVREGGIAVLIMSGVISPKANMFTRVSGGVSAQMLAKQFDSMAADPRVRGVVVDIDSPGGSVLGIPAAASALRKLADEKPTVSVSTGQMASAGYWIGSAANAVYISGETDIVGSIGVVAKHSYDPRKQDVVTTEVTAGKYKRAVSDTGPLTREGKAVLQGQVDEIYRVFVDTVAANRRVDTDAVLANMADGRVFIGQQALEAGLADGIATVDDLVAQMSENPSKFAARTKATFGAKSKLRVAADAGDAPVAEAHDEPVLHVETTPSGAETMTPQELAAAFAAENPEAAALLRAEGASAESERIRAVREQSIPGHEALVEALAFDGHTSAGEAAMQILAAERSKVKVTADNRDSDAPAPIALDPAGDDEPAAAAAAPVAGFSVDPKKAELDAAAKQYMAAHPGTDYIAAIRAVQKGA